MSLFEYLYKKINEEMRIIYITKKKPKQKVRLDPLDPEDINIDRSVVCKWSENNRQLYDLILENGMAEFICNRDFLNQFYQHLSFQSAKIFQIDQQVLQLKNLKVLNLFQNNIEVIKNIPQSCAELYLDFNFINSIKVPHQLNVQLLSISHNHVSDKTIKNIIKKMPLLRCLNVSYNLISDIRAFTGYLKHCQMLKILICKHNPISLLPIYYKYITEQVALNYFDNEKYVKEEEKQPQVEEKKEQKKEQKKEEKKDSKKKGGKQPEKPPQPIEEKVQPPKIQPKVLTEQDFNLYRFEVKINNFQLFTGITGDPSLFTQENLDPKSTQSSYWIQWNFMRQNGSTYEDRIPIEQVTNQADQNRLNFEFSLKKQVDISYENMRQFNEGLFVQVYQEYPSITVDSESGDQKVQLTQQNEIKMIKKCIGGVAIKTEDFHSMKNKNLQKKFNLFEKQVARQPLFKRPLVNEQQLISKNKIKFDAKLAELEQQERKRKEEQEEAAKNQKKGGKDSKKAAQKKGAKKDSKQPVVDKKNVEKCKYEQDQKEYCYFGEQKMYKSLKEQLGVKIQFI